MPRRYTNLIISATLVVWLALLSQSASAGMIILGGEELERGVPTMEVPDSELPAEPLPSPERRFSRGSADGMGGESRSSSPGPSTGGAAITSGLLSGLYPELEDGLPGESRFTLPARHPLELLRPS
jgi:hypothetical protein